MPPTHPTRQHPLLAALLTALAAACSDESEPDPGYQGTAGAAFVPDSGSDTEPVSSDQLPTREQICVEGPPGGLPIKDSACEYHACGDACDPCETGIGQNPGCLMDGGVFRCTWQHICTQTKD